MGNPHERPGERKLKARVVELEAENIRLHTENNAILDVMFAQIEQIQAIGKARAEATFVPTRRSEEPEAAHDAKGGR